jgi:hypothetical protein
MAMMGARKLDPKHVEFFEKKIQPLFKENCYKCHSVEAGKSKADSHSTRARAGKGGETGGLIKPGDPDKSLMITAVTTRILICRCRRKARS